MFYYRSCFSFQDGCVLILSLVVVAKCSMNERMKEGVNE